MDEKDLNRTIVKSLNQEGWAHKISDDAGNFASTSKKPFDYFGINSYYLIFGESKIIKGGLKSFNFHRLEEHQKESLSTIKVYAEMLELDHCYPIVSVGFWEPRKFFYVMFFDIEAIMDALEEGKISVKKKELEAFVEQGMFLPIKKGLVENIELLPEKIIYNF